MERNKVKVITSAADEVIDLQKYVFGIQKIRQAGLKGQAAETKILQPEILKNNLNVCKERLLYAMLTDTDTDLEKSAEKIVCEKFLNAGQNAIAPDYIFVHEHQKNAFVSLLMTKIRQFYENNTYDLKMTTYSRITSDGNFERLRALLKDAIRQGASIVMGGTVDVQERIFHPTLLTNVPYDSAVMKEEIFGPILPVLTYRHIDEVMDYISSNERSFADYPFSKAPSVCDQLENKNAPADCYPLY